MIDIARRFMHGALLVIGVFVLSGAEVQCQGAGPRAQPRRKSATISNATRLDTDRTSSRARSSTFPFCSAVRRTAIS